MADYGQGFMVSKNFCHAYLQEVGLTQLSGDPDRFQDIFQGIFQHTKSIIDSKMDKHHQVVILDW